MMHHVIKGGDIFVIILEDLRNDRLSLGFCVMSTNNQENC